MSESEYEGDIAEPFRYNFEIAWEVANKGIAILTRIYTRRLCT